MPTYFEIINETLQELGYRTKDTFAELTTREEKDIKRKIANINRDVLLEIKSNARKRYVSKTITANSDYVTNDINGEILKQPGGILDLTNKIKYEYIPEHELFELEEVSGDVYGLFANRILFAPQEVDRNLTIYYYTYDTAQSSTGTDKAMLVLETDTPIIPFNLQIRILVNGCCFELNKESTDPRLAYWQSEFIKAKNELRAYSQSEDQKPVFAIGNEQYSFVRNM